MVGYFILGLLFVFVILQVLGKPLVITININRDQPKFYSIDKMTEEEKEELDQQETMDSILAEINGIMGGGYDE